MLYQDASGNYHLIKSCAIANLSDLQLCFEKLASTNNPQSEDTSDGVSPSACDVRKASLLELIAKLSGVSFELLASDIDGVLKAIAEVNFQVTNNEKKEQTLILKEKEESITLQDYQYQLVTSLVNAELVVDLKSALKIAKELPYKDVEGYLKARVNFLNKDQIDNEKAGKELMQELTDGSFFGSTKDGHDGFQKGVMQAMGITDPSASTNTNGDEDMPDSVKKAFDLD